MESLFLRRDSKEIAKDIDDKTKAIFIPKKWWKINTDGNKYSPAIKFSKNKSIDNINFEEKTNNLEWIIQTLTNLKKYVRI